MPVLCAPVSEHAGSSLTDAEFESFRSLIFATTGISLGPGKRALVASRLARRLRELGLATYGDYHDHVAALPPDAPERQQLINCITTNKTEFFRESHHFRFLRERVFPGIEERARRGGPKRIRIWSAACSTGEEPYTMAMTLREHFRSLAGWDVRILASDIDTSVLARAEEGVYPLESLESVPESLRRKYFQRGTGSCAGSCRVSSELRDLISFRRINFMDVNWPVRTTFDAIFCRNVLIYFDRPTQERVVRRLGEHLGGEGYLMLGHSENVAWLAPHLTALGGTVYRVVNSGSATSGRSTGPAAAPAAEAVSPATVAETVSRRPIVVGDVFAAARPTEVSTLLGSCVAVCLFDPEAGVGGMNHILLPGGEEDDPARFGEPAIARLLAEVLRRGGRRERLRAKLFGGAERDGAAIGSTSVGAANVAFTKRKLAEEGIPIDAERVGGDRAVRIRFRTDTGRVLLEALAPPEDRRVIDVEAGELARTAT